MNRRNLIKAGAILTAATLTSHFANANTKARTNIKTLVIVSHPYPERSTFTKALQ